MNTCSRRAEDLAQCPSAHTHQHAYIPTGWAGGRGVSQLHGGRNAWGGQNQGEWAWEGLGGCGECGRQLLNWLGCAGPRAGTAGRH